LGIIEHHLPLTPTLSRRVLGLTLPRDGSCLLAVHNPLISLASLRTGNTFAPVISLTTEFTALADAAGKPFGETLPPELVDNEIDENARLRWQQRARGIVN
jgi:hypothetical protein